MSENTVSSENTELKNSNLQDTVGVSSGSDINEASVSPVQDESFSSNEIRPISSKSKIKNSDKTCDFYFGFGNGRQSLVGTKGSILHLNNFGEPDYCAKDWNLVVKEIEVISLENKIGKTINFSPEMNRGILIGPEGYRLDFSNIEKMTVAKSGTKGPRNKDERHMFLMGIQDNASGWFVIVESSRVLNLGKTDDFIVLNPENSGIIIGPDGNELNFTKISAIKLDTVAK